MKILLKVDIAGTYWSHSKGTVIDVSENEALGLIKADFAERIDEIETAIQPLIETPEKKQTKINKRNK